MPMASDEKPQGGERAETDRSLTDERRKTDEELTKRRLRDEAEADAVVATARRNADDVLELTRVEADRKLQEMHVNEEQGEVLETERQGEDAALQYERASADEVLARERQARRRALAALLALERDRTDETLRSERERADRSINSRDEFLAIVSHDLRNLLGGMAMSAASLLSVQGTEATRNQVVREAQRIQRYTGRMNRLVEDLLDVVSMDAGQLSLVRGREETAELLRETLEVFQPLATAKGVSLHSELKAGSLLARCDHERILQVLANLVGNAVKFTPAGGSIDIRIEPVEREVQFSIIDTGKGIEPEQLEIVFERFWQVLKPARAGVGLGLYISKCIVEAHGGKLWATSEHGKGSTFVFTLPAASDNDSVTDCEPPIG